METTRSRGSVNRIYMTKQRARELLENIRALTLGENMGYNEATDQEHEEVRLKFMSMKNGYDNWHDVLVKLALGL